MRRLSEVSSGRSHFGYDARTLREIADRTQRMGPPTRIGGKSKELRNAVLAAIQTHDVVIALIDARLDELPRLQRDVQDILAQCRERSAEARVAIGLAVHEIEIWLLADPEARKAAFGEAVGEQPVPEDLEGVRDPKALWRAISGQVPPPEGVEGALHEDRQRVAGWATLRPERRRPRVPAGVQALRARRRDGAAVVAGVAPRQPRR